MLLSRAERFLGCAAVREVILVLVAVAVMSIIRPAGAQTTSYLGVQYGLPNTGYNSSGGCAPDYTACFLIPLGKQLHDGKGTLTIKQPNIEVLAYIFCGSSAGYEVVWAADALLQGTIVWSTPELSEQDTELYGNGANACWVSWQANNNTGAPIPPGAAFEIQGVFSTY
jgi:hypothetical protein